MNTENEADYNPQDWQGALRHKHSFTGKAEKKIESVRRRGKKWYARKAVWFGLASGLLAGWLIFQLALKPTRAGNPTAVVYIEDHALTVELANNQAARRAGLMGRHTLPKDGGMLFEWPDSQPRTFWMKNTPLYLDLAFIDENGVITEIIDMAPFDETKYTSQHPARYALEVNGGWFDARDIQPGSRIILAKDRGQ